MTKVKQTTPTLSPVQQARPRRLRTLISLLLPALIATSCASPAQRRFDKHLAKGRCEQAIENLPENDSGVRLVRRTEQTAGTVLSYTLTGASYTAEVLWDVVGGTVMFVALCGPGLAVLGVAMAAGGGSGGPAPLENGAIPFCIPGKIDALGSPPLGRQTYKATEPMRCPDVTPLSRSLREVAACYEARGDRHSLQKAEQTLEALRTSGHFYRCLPKEEQSTVFESLNGLRERLAKTAHEAGSATQGPARDTSFR